MKKLLFVVAILLLTTLPTVAYGYNYKGYHWAGSSPTVTMDLNGLTIVAWVNVAKAVIGEWNGTGAKFKFVSDSQSQNKTYTYYEESAVLAVTNTYFDDNKVIYKATLAINNYYNFNPPFTTGSWTDIKSVMRHEFGHWLSLGHSSSKPAVMYYSIPPKTIKTIYTDDINGIKAIYGKR